MTDELRERAFTKEELDAAWEALGDPPYAIRRHADCVLAEQELGWVT